MLDVIIIKVFVQENKDHVAGSECQVHSVDTAHLWARWRHHHKEGETRPRHTIVRVVSFVHNFFFSYLWRPFGPTENVISSSKISD